MRWSCEGLVMVRPVSGSDRWLNKNRSRCHGGLLSTVLHLKILSTVLHPKILSTVCAAPWEAAQPDATHIHAGEKTYARLIPGCQLISFLPIFLRSKSRSWGAHCPKKLSFSVSHRTTVCVGSISPFVSGQIVRQIGILQNNRTLACDECEGSIARYLQSNQMRIWGRVIILHVTFNIFLAFESSITVVTFVCGICCPISWEFEACKNSCLPDVSVHQLQPTWSSSVNKLELPC